MDTDSVHSRSKKVLRRKKAHKGLKIKKLFNKSQSIQKKSKKKYK